MLSTLVVVGIGAMVLIGLVYLACREGESTRGVPPVVPVWVTRDEVQAMLDARDKRPVRWVSEHDLKAHVHNNNLKFSVEVREDIRRQLGAYCRKSLATGELLARVTTLVEAILDSREETKRAQAVVAEARHDAIAELSARAKVADRKVKQHARKGRK